jgi:hypothetical protein
MSKSSRNSVLDRKASTDTPAPNCLTDVTVQEAPAPSIDRHELIASRAYALWEKAGRPDGEAARNEFWHAAESEILATQTSRP